MFTRQNAAEFLQGLFVLPLCVLFGGLIALLFHWPPLKSVVCIAFFTLFPFLGAIKTKQRSLLAGLLTGLALTVAFYFAARPHP